MNAKGEMIISGFILALSAFLFYVATTFPRLKVSDRLGSAFWPEVILSIVIILSACMFIGNMVRVRKGKPERQSRVQHASREDSLRLTFVIILSLLYAFCVPYLGFLLCIVVFQVIFLLLLKVKKIVTVVLYPLAITLCVYIVFIKILYIPLPRGRGIFLTLSRIFY
jgi:hypothetical protein